MRDTTPLHVEGRRAAFLEALRRGSRRATAWHAARLRLRDLALTPREAQRARDARRAWGRALRRARRRDALVLATPGAIATQTTRSRRRYTAALAAAAGAALLLLLLLPRGDGGTGELPGGGGAREPEPGPERPLAVVAPPLRESRGRVIFAPPLATPAPEPSPTASPLPASAAPAGGGSGAGSGSSGAGGGSGTSTGTGTGTPAGPLPGSTVRLSGRVFDASTFLPIKDVCVTIGALACTPIQARTDANGYWSIDIPARPGQIHWDVRFEIAGYEPVTIRATSRGADLTLGTLLRRRAGP